MRLPRFAYWILGGGIALAGALAARSAAAAYPTYQVPLWLVGGALIFLGLAVLSLGTRSRTEGDEQGHGDED